MEAAEMPGSLKVDQQCAESAGSHVQGRFQIEIPHSEHQRITDQCLKHAPSIRSPLMRNVPGLEASRRGGLEWAP